MHLGRFQERPARHPVFPSDLRCIDSGDRCLRLGIQFTDLRVKRGEFCFLFWCRQFHDRRRILAVAIHRFFGDVVEIRVELIKLLLRNRIILVVMALCASDS